MEDAPAEVAEQDGVERPQAGRDPGVEREAPVMEGGQAARERGARSAPGNETRDEENRGASPTELDARPADSTTRVRPVEEAALGPPAAKAPEPVRGRVPNEGAGCGCSRERPAARSPARLPPALRRGSPPIHSEARGRRRRRPRSRTGSGTRRAAGRAGRRAHPRPQDRSRRTPAVDSPPDGRRTGHDGRRELPTAGLADRPRAARRPAAAARSGPRALAGPGAVPRGRAGRCHPARRPGHGARRAWT